MTNIWKGPADTAVLYAKIFAEKMKAEAEAEHKKRIVKAGYDLMEAIRDNIVFYQDGETVRDFLRDIKENPKFAVEVLSERNVLQQFIKYVEVIYEN